VPVTGPKLGAGLVKMARAIESASKDTVNTSALRAKVVQEKAIASVAGSDMSLSGANKAKGRPGGVKVGVRYKLEMRGSSPQAFLRATGPLQLIENNTAGHVIRSAYTSGAARKGFIGPGASGQFSTARGGNFIGPTVSNRRGVISIPGVGFRRSARHPGTTGQHPWRKGRKLAEPIIQQSMSKRTFNVVKGAARP